MSELEDDEDEFAESDEEALESARDQAATVSDFLADGEWEIVANLTSARRLSAQQLEAAVRDLPIDLVRMPVDQRHEIEVEAAAAVRGRRRFSAVVPLWTSDGKSRWVLELTVRELSGGFLEARTSGFRRRKATDKTPEQLANDRRSAVLNPQSWPLWDSREAEVLGRVPTEDTGRALRAGDVAAQLWTCLDDVRVQLEREQLSLSDIREVTVQTTDFPAARAQAGALSRWQREHGAWDQVSFQVVDALEPPGAAVQVAVRAVHHELLAGQVPESTSDEPVPEHLRPALRAELDALARGERPEQMLCVEEYGDDGATLVVQPEAIWDHRSSSATRYDDGSWWVILPLWTERECPSDLSAQLEVDPSGVVSTRSVHVM